MCNLQGCSLVQVVLDAPGVQWFGHSPCRHVSGVESKLDKLQYHNTRLHH